jgi:hypothetical protein
VRLFPERTKSARRLFLWALVASLMIHLIAGPLASWIAALLPRPHTPREIAQHVQTITIEHLRPMPTPKPTPVPTPVPTPTPPPPKPKIESQTTVANHQATKGAPGPVVKKPRPQPRVVAVKRPRAQPPPAAPVRKAAPVIAHHVELAKPRAHPVHQAASGALDPQQVAALNDQFSKTIAQAQHEVQQGPQTESGPVQTMHQYNPVLEGNASDMNLVTGGGTCTNTEPYKTEGGYNYYYLSCDTMYSDGFKEQVQFPWLFKFPVRNDPMLRGGRFPVQPPPPGFVLPDPFPLSRMVCDFYRPRCAAVIAKERANGTADLYGKPP